MICSVNVLITLCGRSNRLVPTRSHQKLEREERERKRESELRHSLLAKKNTEALSFLPPIPHSGVHQETIPRAVRKLPEFPATTSFQHYLPASLRQEISQNVKGF